MDAAFFSEAVSQYTYEVSFDSAGQTGSKRPFTAILSPASARPGWVIGTDGVCSGGEAGQAFFPANLVAVHPVTPPAVAIGPVTFE
jgi:hypothetical protein